MKFLLKKLISYLIPFTKSIQSEYSGRLELTIINGKKVLDTLNTNYSFGSLQRILRFSLNQLDLSQIKTILILGLGGGSVIQTLKEEKNFEGKITAVEIDPVMIDIADREFNVTSDEQLKIICDDAWNFVNKESNTYDLIIVDLFLDNRIPDKFLSLEFWERTLKLLTGRGYVIFNTLHQPETDLTALEKMLRQKKIDYKVFSNVENTNKVLIAHYDIPSLN